MVSEVITVIPTRGLIFAETLRSLKLNGLTDTIIVSGLPIPDAQNEAVREALKQHKGYVLFIEDDMSFPENTLEKLIKLDAAVACVDYPMDNGYSTITRQGDEILWCGLGCTLVKRGVLSIMKDNWFDTSYSWKINEPFSLERIDSPYKYGGLDINFFIKVRSFGFEIKQAHGIEAQHLRCKNLIKSQYNAGALDISALPPVSKRQQY